MLHFARVANPAALQGCVQTWGVGNKSSGGCCAFAGSPRNQQPLADLVGIFYHRDRRERTTCLPAGRGWYIGSRFLGTWMIVADEFRFRFGVKYESEVKLVAEQC